jgi:hypothetical protein
MATIATPAAAQHAFDFFQSTVRLVSQHHVQEPALRILSSGSVQLQGRLPWNMAPTVFGLELPVVRLATSALHIFV